MFSRKDFKAPSETPYQVGGAFVKPPFILSLNILSMVSIDKENVDFFFWCLIKVINSLHLLFLCIPFISAFLRPHTCLSLGLVFLFIREGKITFWSSGLFV